MEKKQRKMFVWLTVYVSVSGLYLKNGLLFPPGNPPGPPPKPPPKPPPPKPGGKPEKIALTEWFLSFIFFIYFAKQNLQLFIFATFLLS